MGKQADGQDRRGERKLNGGRIDENGEWAEPANLEFGSCRLDLKERRLCRNGQEQTLPARKFELLRLLMINAGKVVNKNEIFRVVWPDRFVDESNLSQNIHYLRHIIEDNPQSPVHLLTIPGAGYMFRAEQTRIVTTRSVTTSQSTDPALVLPASGSSGQRSDSGRGEGSQSLAGLSDAHRLPFLISIALLIIVASSTVIWVLRKPDSSLPVPLTTNNPFITMSGAKGALAFSPDGKRLAFTSKTNDSFSLYVRDVFNERIVRLSKNQFLGSRLAWSPDGRQIAVLGRLSPEDWTSYVFCRSCKWR